MKPLRARLQEARKRFGVPWEVLERDYLLSWILAGISQVENLSKSIVFKGGTALKKCYFGTYRFSEDLDFSAIENVPRGVAMEKAMQKACEIAKQLMDPYTPIELVCSRHEERKAHPGSQEAFDIRARFPWQHEPLTNVMVEIAVDEPILKPHVERAVIHEYGEVIEAKFLVYALEEMLSEKLRGILQQQKLFQKRGWVRSRARDYYDLWRILGELRDQLDLAGFIEFLNKKCAVRSVNFTGHADFFPEAMLAEIERTWEQWLGPLVPNLPSFNRVVTDLRPLIQDLIQVKP